jgi:hypothetical protein
MPHQNLIETTREKSRENERDMRKQVGGIKKRQPK